MDIMSVVWFAVGAFALLLLLDVLSTPLSIALQVLANSMAGGLSLFLANAAFGWAGLHLPVNPVSAVLTGMLGLPGVVGLIVLRTLLV